MKLRESEAERKLTVEKNLFTNLMTLALYKGKKEDMLYICILTSELCCGNGPVLFCLAKYGVGGGGGRRKKN
jgi:hypothetical protein